MSFMHRLTDSIDTQINAVRAVDQLSQAIFDDIRTGGDQFKKQQDDDEGQTMQFEYLAQVGTFQVKAIVCEVAEHLFPQSTYGA